MTPGGAFRRQDSAASTALGFCRDNERLNGHEVVCPCCSRADWVGLRGRATAGPLVLKRPLRRSKGTRHKMFMRRRSQFSPVQRERCVLSQSNAQCCPTADHVSVRPALASSAFLFFFFHAAHVFSSELSLSNDFL